MTYCTFRLVPGHFYSEIKLEDDKLLVTREIDGGLQTIKLNMPSIVTTDLRLNEPRYASLPNIMKAKKKEIAEKTPEDLNITIEAELEIIKVSNQLKGFGWGKSRNS